MRTALPSQIPPSPQTTSSAIAGVGRLAKTTRPCDATAAGESSAVAPAATSRATAASSRSQT
jgi:hypothetical protein